MRFGLFVPQGWRMDLAGIDPAEQWRRCRRRTPRRAGPVRVDLGVRPLPHRAGADRGGDARGVDADGGVRRVHLARAARPDVHLHGLPQPGVPGQGGRHHRRHLRRPGRDGHRRPVGTSTNGAPTVTASPARASGSACSTRACRSCRSCGAPAPPPSTGSTTRSTAPSRRPLPLQDGGIPLWIAGGGEKKTLRIAAQHAQYTNFDGTAEGFAHKSEVLAAHCQDLGTRLRRRSPARPTTTSSSARPRPTSATGWRGSTTTTTRC